MRRVASFLTALVLAMLLMPPAALEGDRERVDLEVTSGRAEKEISIEVSAKRIDFGTVPIGSESRKETIEIKNDGDMKVRVTARVRGKGILANKLFNENLTLNGENLDDFEVEIEDKDVAKIEVQIEMPGDVKPDTTFVGGLTFSAEKL